MQEPSAHRLAKWRGLSGIATQVKPKLGTGVVEAKTRLYEEVS